MSLDLSDSALVKAYEDVRSDKSETDWCLIGYAAPKGNKMALIGSGDDGLTEMTGHLNDDIIAYGFLRLDTGDAQSKRAKFVYITWVGPSCSALKRGKVSVHKVDMKQLIKDFAVEIYATSQEDLDIDAISAKVTKAMGANYSGDNGMLRSKGSRSAARGKSSSKSAPEAPPAPKSVSPKAAAPPVPAPPAAAEGKTELNGNRWSVENHKGTKEQVVVELKDVSKNQTVNIYNCSNAAIIISGKVNAIVIDKCTKTGVVFDGCVAVCEIINSTKTQVQVKQAVPAVQADNCSGLTLYLPESSLTTELVCSKSSEVNIVYPAKNPDDDMIEAPVPEQYKHVFDKKTKTWTSEILSHV